MPDVAVPFDFDGQRILWMEYKSEEIKEFQYYDLSLKTIKAIKEFGPEFHFLSHGRLVKR